MIRGTSSCGVSPQQLDAGVTEVEGFLGPGSSRDRSQTDEYLAGFPDSSPLAKLGEYRLFMAIFADAMSLVLAAARPKLAKAKGHSRAFRRIPAPERRDIIDALVWFLSPGKGHLYSFENILEVLSLDDERIRRLAYQHLRVTPEELREFLHAEIPVIIKELPGRGRGRPRKNKV